MVGVLVRRDEGRTRDVRSRDQRRCEHDDAQMVRRSQVIGPPLTLRTREKQPIYLNTLNRCVLGRRT